MGEIMSWKVVKPDQNICSYHSVILEKVKDLQNIREGDYETVADVLWKVSDLADDIEKAVSYALVCGEHMEGRLQDYRDAIESLGFQRIKKQ